MNERSVHVTLAVPGVPSSEPITVFLPISIAKKVLEKQIREHRFALVCAGTGEELLAEASQMAEHIRALSHLEERPVNELGFSPVGGEGAMADRIIASGPVPPELARDVAGVGPVPDFLPSEDEVLGDIAAAAEARARDASSVPPENVRELTRDGFLETRAAESRENRMLNYLGALYRAGKALLDAKVSPPSGWVEAREQMQAALILPPDLEAAIEALPSDDDESPTTRVFAEGDRVRVVECPSHPERVNRIGTVEFRRNCVGDTHDYGVKLDGDERQTGQYQPEWLEPWVALPYPPCQCGHRYDHHQDPGDPRKKGCYECPCPMYRAKEPSSPSERIDARLDHGTPVRTSPSGVEARIAAAAEADPEGDLALLVKQRDALSKALDEAVNNLIELEGSRVVDGKREWGELPRPLSPDRGAPILVDLEEWADFRSFDTTTREWAKEVLAATLQLTGEETSAELAQYLIDSNLVALLVGETRDHESSTDSVMTLAARIAKVCLDIYRAETRRLED